MSYCDSAYGHAIRFAADSVRLQRIQNSCLRFFFGVRKYDHISSFLTNSGWLNLEKLRSLHLLTTAHAGLTTPEPDYIPRKLKTFANINRFGIYKKSVWVIPKYNSVTFTSSFSYNAPKFYNQLPNVFGSYKITNIKNDLRCIFLSFVDVWKIYQTRFISFQDTRKIIKQFWFTKGSSTQDALVLFYYKILKTFNGEHKVTAQFVDRPNAFELNWSWYLVI